VTAEGQLQPEQKSCAEIFRVFLAHREPLLSVRAQLIGLKLSASRVFWIVAVYLRVTFKTHGDCVLVGVRSIVSLLDYMIQLNFHAAETMAHTAAAMTGN
jgi:hypothetical protein